MEVGSSGEIARRKENPLICKGHRCETRSVSYDYANAFCHRSTCSLVSSSFALSGLYSMVESYI